MTLRSSLLGSSSASVEANDALCFDRYEELVSSVENEWGGGFGP
jgi:hypothetical protein